jgi:predicted metalloprotease with PDZ domain
MRLAIDLGEDDIWNGPVSARDVAAIVREHVRMWGSVPYPRYVFFNLITEGSGGLEHVTSTAIMTTRWRRTRSAYLSWLGTVSHEFFHAWNVKRLRPVALGPFDYEQEAYTPDLWIAEGFTSYYGNLALRRAGLSNDAEYMQTLSHQIEQLQTTPGRLVRSADLSSFDAWIRYYRPDENSPNSSVSYYIKGQVVAFLLDAKIRRATNGAKSLDDLMRTGYGRYSGARGYTSEEFRRLASDVAGVDLSTWFADAAGSTKELDYAEALDWFGLRFRNIAPSNRAWTGLVAKPQEGRLVVTEVHRGTPAYAAGINVDDEILAIGEYRVRADQWDARLDQYRPGEQVTMLVARRERLVRLPLTLGAEPERRWAGRSSGRHWRRTFTCAASPRGSKVNDDASNCTSPRPFNSS